MSSSDGQISIMHIDDNDIDIFLTSKLLKISKITDDINSFTVAKNALNYISENSVDMSRLPDLILLDIQMPGMNGFDFLDEFAKFPQEVIDRIDIYMLSSTIDHNDLNRAKENPHVIKVLRKPLDVDALKQILSK